MTVNYTYLVVIKLIKGPRSIPNGHKGYQNFSRPGLSNFTQSVDLGKKIPSGNPVFSLGGERMKGRHSSRMGFVAMELSEMRKDLNYSNKN
jgi:hypothetical protein